MTNIKNKQLLEWLNSQDESPLQLQGKYDDSCIFFKWKVTENVAVIYGKYLWSSDKSDLEFTKQPKYLGLFSQAHHMLYDAQMVYEFSGANDFYDPEPNTRGNMIDAIKKQVNQEIWNRFENSDKLKSPEVIKEHEYFIEHYLEKKASEYFVFDGDLKDLQIIGNGVDDTAIFRYVDDPDDLIKNMADKVIAERGKHYYESFLNLIAISHRIDEIKKDPFHPAQAAKRIKETIDVYRTHRGVNNVRVGILDKDGNEIEVMIDADVLIRDLLNGINQWHLEREKDKVVYKKFPKSQFFAEDIVSISFGRTCLYNVEQYRNRVHCWSWDFPDRKITIDLDAEAKKEEK